MTRCTFDRAARTALVLALAAFGTAGVAHAAAAAAAAESPDSALATYDGGAVYPHEFAPAWQGLQPPDREGPDVLKLKREFVHRIVDRELLLREALKRPVTMMPAEKAAYERTRRAYLQNALFEHMRRQLPPVSEEDLRIFTRQNRELAMIRFVSFKDVPSANAWRQRLVRGIPMSVLDGAIQKGGPDAPTADEPRAVAAELVPDSLAQRIWAMRPGEVSDVIVHGSEVALIHVLSFIPRTSPVQLSNPAAVEAAFSARIEERLRQKIRVQFHHDYAVRYDETNTKYLLDRFQKTVPPRQTTDASGTPNYRLTMPMPQIATSDSVKLLVTTSRGDSLTIGGYVRFWDNVPATQRPDIQEMDALTAAIDRVLFADILVEKAVEQGLERDSVVVAGLQRFREASALDHYYLDEVWNRVDMSMPKLEAYFASKPGHYDDPESIKPRLIQVDSKQLADSLRARLDAGDSFSDLAEKFSIHGESAAKGGQLGTIARGMNASGNVSLEDAMFAAPVGKIGGPTAVPEGFVIWVVDAHFPVRRRTLKDPDALGWVRRDYQIEESERILGTLLAKLQEDAHVKYFPERVTKDLGADFNLGVQ
jgi:parvulin-like peptidyl-prolyl isomerase